MDANTGPRKRRTLGSALGFLRRAAADCSGAAAPEYVSTLVVPTLSVMAFVPLIAWGLNDIFEQTSGEIVVVGVDILQFDLVALRVFRRRKISLVFQSF